jgi:hypothetical protein
MGLKCVLSENLAAKASAETAKTDYAIHYESYGS